MLHTLLTKRIVKIFKRCAALSFVCDRCYDTIQYDTLYLRAAKS